jgi:hypothetical protein
VPRAWQRVKLASAILRNEANKSFVINECCIAPCVDSSDEPAPGGTWSGTDGNSPQIPPAAAGLQEGPESENRTPKTGDERREALPASAVDGVVIGGEGKKVRIETRPDGLDGASDAQSGAGTCLIHQNPTLVSWFVSKRIRQRKPGFPQTSRISG